MTALLGHFYRKARMSAAKSGQTIGEVREMLPENELIQYVYKTADMGCEGIECVIGAARSDALRQVLHSQLGDYQKLREDAARMLHGSGDAPKGVGPMARASSRVMSAGKLSLDSSDSKIAEMTIQGNNMGVTKTIEHLHDYAGGGEAEKLAKKLLATEQANVEQLKPFL